MADEPKFKLKSINQIAIVVNDVDKTMEAYWRNFGIGPWQVFTYGPELVKGMTYRGKPGRYRAKIAIAECNGMLFELMQHLDGESLYKEFAEQNGEGIQHLGIFVEDFAKAVAEAEAAGLEVIQSGHGYGQLGDGGYAYLETAGELGTCFEIICKPKVRTQPDYVYPPQEQLGGEA